MLESGAGGVRRVGRRRPGLGVEPMNRDLHTCVRRAPWGALLLAGGACVAALAWRAGWRLYAVRWR